MTKEDMLKCLENIDDTFIEEAASFTGKNIRIQMIKVAAVAACVVFVIGITMFYLGSNDKTETKEAKNKTESHTTAVPGGNTPFFNPVGGMEFAYNNTTYRVVDDEAFLASNSMPININGSETGKRLKSNIYDLSNNIVLGDLYEYKNSEDLSTVILQLPNGAYNFAVENNSDE